MSSRLQQIRQQRHLSRRQVASVIGYSEKQLERWEKGVTRIKRGQLLMLAEVYGVDVSDLEVAA